MDPFEEYVEEIESPDHRERTREILKWVMDTFPHLQPQIKWNTPMFTHHESFIIGFSTAKGHMSVSPEQVGMKRFAEAIAQANYSATKGLFRIRWNQPVDYELLEKIISFNIQDKSEDTHFWRQ